MKAVIRARRRRYLRFSPSTVTYADLDFRKSRLEFKSQCIGFVFNEAQGGCALVVPGDLDVEIGDRLRVRLGGLAAVDARVAWTESVDAHVCKIGLEYLDE